MRNPSGDFWNKKRVLVTGHTGFKGAWLLTWLQKLGAQVTGFSLAPENMSLYNELKIANEVESNIGDIRSFNEFHSVCAHCNPEIIFHLAAQALVRPSYKDPLETYSTNVMGTVHVLESVRKVDSVRAVVVITSDKCYQNKEWAWGYRECDPLGGYDPYSSSKACSEIISSAYRSSYLSAAEVGLATARAGNVIGGGDWAIDRIVPDVYRAVHARNILVVRNPHATRPWQHVLEPLCGYLLLAEELYGTHKVDFSAAWNFGPRDQDVTSVEVVVEYLLGKSGSGLTWELEKGATPHEARSLKLDVSMAMNVLKWAPRWTLNDALDHTHAWYERWATGESAYELCQSQIRLYESGLPK
jgi:CDP-glucose 4,6-dehydratase